MSKLDPICDQINGCTRCPLHHTRTRPVPGEGPEDANIMVIGEGPGQAEDQTGKPFVGSSGKLLTSMLKAAGIPRNAVWIGNTVKCRPPGNRDPELDELIACKRHIEQQIEAVQPKVIITLGKVATGRLSRKTGQMSALMEDTLSYNGVIPIIPAYHPSYALRKAQEGEGTAVKDTVARLKKAAEVAE